MVSRKQEGTSMSKTSKLRVLDSLLQEAQAALPRVRVLDIQLRPYLIKMTRWTTSEEEI